MSEYLKKIIIPNFSGEGNEITILSPDEVYTKDQIDGFDLVAVVKISQADYNKLDDYSPRTLYVIPDKRIYLGNSLVWKKPVYQDNDLAGSWEEDSSHSLWGFYSDNTFISLEDITDTETKEFIKDLSDYSGTIKRLSTGGIRRLYHVPKNGGINLLHNTSLISADFSGVKFRESVSDLFMDSSLKYLNLTDVDTSSVTSMWSMFVRCESLQSLDLSSFDTSKVTNMNSMFSACSLLESLDLSSFDTSKVTDMGEMFAYCRNLQSLDLSSFDTSKVTNMWAMFGSCESLQSLDLSSFDTSKVTNMFRMFGNCESLQSLDLSSFDISKVTITNSMFTNCYSLKSLNLSSFDISNVTDMEGMFRNCTSLVDVMGPIHGIKNTYYLDLSHCSKLSQESAMVFIEGLETVTSTKTIVFSQNTFDSLTPEQISIATSKGWTVVRN